MSTDHRSRLREIRTFPQLVAYLRDEMGWPIGAEDFEELTFEYTPEELGIDAKNAAKIQEIKRLRPLSTHQPWGIFFVKFEPKRLPVVALRRILSQVALKRRASANSAERAAWSDDDLLFVSNYGEGESRQISFAHFSRNEAKRDLPTLKVLGWDNLDTPLHLDHVAELLTERLAWPDDDEDEEEWRKQWRSAFTLVHREVITTSKKLSVELAGLARNIRARINTILEIETEEGPVSKLMGAFKQALVHDLDEDGFADMYAQTIAYGLLSARVANPSGGTADDFAAAMPVTNPFLKELMETFLTAGGRKSKAESTGLDFDELGVSEVVELLDVANMEAVVRDFGDRNPQEDPVIHFYELFLKEYDAKKRMQRGVFYTPRPVVSFIVRSVDELLRTEFGLEDGLADTTTWGEMDERFDDVEIPQGATPDQAFVQILDPATGTGTFLVEVIDLIHKTLTEKWQAEGHGVKQIDQLWNDYVPRHLLPRLHGYELMMAPYAIAHMKIGLKLYETGYRFSSDERARVYLTNALEPAHDFSGTLAFAIPALAHEAEEVNAIKRDQRFTVVIGNPPYSSSITEPPWLMERLKDWKRDLNEKKLDLNREEWKFLRFGEHLCERSGYGVVGHVINRDFLDGIAKRRMREHLQDCFPIRIVYDLNGDVKGNVRDENVFEIKQGVCVVILAKAFSAQRQTFNSIVGTRVSKYEFLSATIGSSEARTVPLPTSPYFSWVPLVSGDLVGSWERYEQWPSVTSIFPVHSSGIQTKRDRLCVHRSQEDLWATVQEFNRLPVEDARHAFALGEDGRDWTVARAKSDLAASGPSEEHITPILYRPFDLRFTYWTGRSKGFLAYPRRDVMRHVVGRDNIGLLFNRQIVGDGVSHFGVSRFPTCHGTFYLGNKGQDYFAPLYLFEDGLMESVAGRPNLSAGFLEGAALSPEQVLGYVYAVCWSPTYRTRYEPFLKRDFARIPVTNSQELLTSLTGLGGELITFHLLEAAELDNHITSLIGSCATQVEKVSHSDETVWIDKAKTRGFRGVPEEVWNFRFGGYQVCKTWLKARQARGGKSPRPASVLTHEDIDHYQRIVVALNETIRIMAEIDEVIDEHGGWPEAFKAQEPGT